jgi:glutaredoxin
MKLTLYTRVNCHLCDEAKAALERVRALEPFDLEVLDVDADPDLKRQYDWEVPVILVDGEKWAKYRFEEAALLKRLRAPTSKPAAASSGGGGA